MWVVAAALISCGKEIIPPQAEPEAPVSIVFNLTADSPDATRVMKEDWAAGDVIFVFFDNVAAPRFLKMSFDGSSWTSEEYVGSTAAPGALGLRNGDSGTMRAVHLPFGNDAVVSADGTSFVFNKTMYTYYMTGALDYTVAENAVSGSFTMEIPEGYVQFSVMDYSSNDSYSLQCDAVIPVGVASIGADGVVHETMDKTFRDELPGYFYLKPGVTFGSYLFSGKLNADYPYTDYYFAKKKGNIRRDYCVSGKELSSHLAVTLPDGREGRSDKWIEVGSGKTVKFRMTDPYSGDYTYEWYTCNYRANAPEEFGTKVYGLMNQYLTGTDIDRIGNGPYTYDFSFLLQSDVSRFWLTVKGQRGVVFKSGSSFLFLPANENDDEYWTLGYDGDYRFVFKVNDFTFPSNYVFSQHFARQCVGRSSGHS